MKHRHNRATQRGVAVIMALLLTTLAITIVASLFWQQQVQVRLIENQRLQLQKQWILRGALDWASLILREDAKHSSVDTLDEPWAAPLAETRLDQYLENGKADGDIADTTLAGGIEDAQARFNLNDLASMGIVDQAAIATFARLLTHQHLPPELARSTAEHIARVTKPANKDTTVNASASLQAQSQPIALQQTEDLLSIPEWTTDSLSRIEPYVICLPVHTPVNLNTAKAETIAAVLDISMQDANILVNSRRSASFRDLADASNRLPRPVPFSVNNADTSTRYFLLTGKVHMNRARLDMLALLERTGATTKTLWIVER